MNICIFPGTFNPIHHAHLMMANFALTRYKFDKIIFIPSYIPPHKNVNRNLADHRYEMVKLAIKQNPKFEISAMHKSQYPKNKLPEIVLAGKSNVGKSSFVNALTNRKSLARTSSEPRQNKTNKFL